MDPTGSQQALSDQGVAIGRHEQSIQIVHQNISALARSVDALVQSLLSSAGAAAHPVAAAVPTALGGS